MRRKFCLVVFLANITFAAAPTITELQPRGAELGRPFTLTLAGRNLVEGARITSTFPASFTLLAPSAGGGMMMAPGRAATFLVEPRPDAVPGVYPIRIETAGGISNILLFTAGTFPETSEQESQPYSRPNQNDSIETAEPLQAAPLTVNGTLRGPERDVYRVYGKGGESRVFEVEARRCGSAIDPVIRILDSAGEQLARGNDSAGAGLDARLTFTFPKEGNYYVEVTDARFSTQAQNFYRLKMGSYAYADGLFPLGGRRGEQVPVTLFGEKLANPAKVTVDLRKAAAGQEFASAALPKSPTLPFLFAVSDLPELIEPADGVMPIPSVVNGRLMKAGEVDRYRLKVEPGDKLLLELQARELGTSRIEGVITVFDSEGKILDSAGDKPLPEDVFAVQGTSRTSSDPFLNLTVPEEVHEIAVTVEDLALRGGPLYGYRLMARREPEDFYLSINSPFVNVPAGGTATVDVVADRRGYEGPIQLTITDLPKGLHVEGGVIPREYVDANNARTTNRRGVLLITADAGVELPSRELEVWGEGQSAGGKTLRRRAYGTGIAVSVAGATAQGVVDRQRPLTAPWLGLELPMAVGDPAIAVLELRQKDIKRMEEGARYEFEYAWKVPGRGIKPPEKVSVDVIGARDIRIIDQNASDDGLSGTFVVTTTKATDPARYDMYISGTVETETGNQIVVSRPIGFEVTGGSSTAHVASNQ